MLAGALLIAAGYLVLWRSGSRSLWRPLSFLGGAALVVIALESPVDYLGDHYSFAWHMVQHMVLGTVAPPLMVLGFDREMAERTMRLPLAGGAVAFLTSPVVAIVAFCAVWIGWHYPPLYDATLSDENLHIAEHLSMIAAGVMFWWLVFRRTRARTPSHAAVLKVTWILAVSVPMALLSGLLMAQSQADYTPYLFTAMRVGFSSAAADEQLGGVVMIIVHVVVFGTAAAAILAREVDWESGEL